VRIDAALRRRVLAHGCVITSDRAHQWEHSLEVQLPFLQSVLRDFALLPLVAGEASPDEVAEVLDLVWGGPETLIVVSTDLSHFHDAATAREKDAATCRRILALEPRLAGDEACGCIGVNGFLAARHNLVPQLLDCRNSGDTAGDPQRVVGYGAFAFYETDS
jgi:AmmeMemoRadiSam system protein B